MDISLILSKKFAGTEWSLNGNKYENLVWLSDTPKPSKQELEELWPGVEYEQIYSEVQIKRSLAYQQESDPLRDYWLREENGVTKEDWLAKVAEIRNRYPYPEQPSNS